ncbi:hypothetical protein KCU99_g6450, partial [Aureobasidium melanogenum]
MHLVLSFAALVGAAVAQDVSSTVNTQCFTRYALQSAANIETVDLATTTTRTATVSVTETPQETVTPPEVTSSVTTTRTVFETTTLPIHTDTYTTSVTMSTTLTNTETESYTQTVTTSSTTTVQSTTTVPAPAGFTALAQMAGYAQKRNAVVERREALQSRGEIKGVLPIIPAAEPASADLVARAVSTSTKKSSSTSSKKTSTTSSKNSAATSSCVASDPVIAAIKNDFGTPLAFCQWWVGASYKSTSPIPGISPADINRVCSCIKATPALIGGSATKAMASPTGVSKVANLDTLRKLVAQPLPFCSFYLNSPTRSGSPFAALSAPAVSQVCKAVTATPTLVSSAKSTSTKSSSTSTKSSSSAKVTSSSSKPVTSSSSKASISQLPTVGQQYPVAVSCTRSTTILATLSTTFTAATVTSTAPVPTKMITFTNTFTSTVTEIPADQTKIITIATDTVTSTSTSTSSTTETQTATFTVAVASATFLAQCAPANIVSSAVGQKIGTISFNKAFTLQSLYLQDTTGYGCCAQCALTENCAGYAQAPVSQGGACYYLTTDGRCDVEQSWGDRFHYYNTNGAGYQVGNGQCGFLGPQAGVPTL